MERRLDVARCKEERPRPAHRRPLVDLVDQLPVDLAYVHVPALPVDSVQFCRLFVSSDGGEDREYLILMAHHPPLSAETCEGVEAVLEPLYPRAEPLRDCRRLHSLRELVPEVGLEPTRTVKPAGF